MRRLAGGTALALLGLAALAGVLLSAAFLAVSTEAGRALLLPRLLAAANQEIAGSLSLGGFSVGRGGALELRQVRLRSPDGEPVVEVELVRGTVDLSRLRSRRVSLRLELERPRLDLHPGPDGKLNFEAAVAPRRPRPPSPAEPFTWTVRLARLEVRGGEVRWRGAGEAAPVEAGEISIDARGIYGPRGGRGELSLRGALRRPEARALELDLRAAAAGPRVTVPLLRLRVGDAGIELVADGEPEARKGRAAALSLRVRGDDLRPVAPDLALGDIGARAYAESDGTLASAALEVRPGDGKDGGAEAAAAARLPPAALAAGFLVRADGLDPRRLAGLLPPGDLNLSAAGHASGTSLSTLRGALQLSVAPSRLRAGRFGPAELRARAAAGDVGFRVQAALPGAGLAGHGAWKPRGPVQGALDLQSADLAALTANLRALGLPAVPPLRGSARLQAGLSGTAAAPVLRIQAAAPSVAAPAAGASAAGLTLDAELAGTRARLDAAAARLSAPSLEARQITARARLEGDAAEVGLSALLPEVGDDPFALRAAGTFGPGRRTFALADAGLAWPGTRFTLEAPALVRLDGPAVDRLALRAGPQRLAVEGGLDRGKLDVRASGAELDLARVPARLLPAGLGLAGRLSFQAEARGAPAAPLATAHVELAGAAARGLTGIDAAADLRWDGVARRGAGSATVRGLAGGELEARADLPADLARARPVEAVDLRLSARGLRVAELLRAARVEAPLDGVAALSLSLQGTAGEPRAEASASLAGGRWEELTPLALAASADLPGSRARVRASADHAGARAAELDLSAPLDLAALLRRPEETLRALRTAPLSGRVDVPGLELAPLARQGLLPEGTAGRLTARADLAGSAAAPRGTMRLALAGLAAGGLRHLAVEASAVARDGATELVAAASAGGAEALTVTGSLGAPLERLLEPAARDAAPLKAQARVRGLDLSRLEGPVGLQGRATLELEAEGSLAAPEVALQAGVAGLGLSDRPLGDLAARGRAGRDGLTALATFKSASGGTVDGSLEAAAPVTARALADGRLAEAPAKARLVADHLDLAFLPSAAPGLFRAASGKLDARLEAQGPLSRLRPQGTLNVAGARATVAGLGDWHGIFVDVRADADALEVSRLEAHRGDGRFQGRLRLDGLTAAGAPARLSGEVHVTRLLLSFEGQDLVTLDLDGKLSGTADARGLDADLEVQAGEAKLPRKTPRTLQSLEPRSDIVLVRRDRRPPPAGPPARPYRTSLHLLVPGNFKVTSAQPQADVALRGELRLTREGGPMLAEGRIEVPKGFFEYSERLFTIRRAAVVFAGEEVSSGTIDAEAGYDNPVAKVTIAVAGPLGSPIVKMTSVPPLDESQIAMLIVTGRVDVKPGSGAAGPPTGADAGYALLGTMATQALQTTLDNKLPVDMVAFDSGQIRMGKYVNDKIYVGYTRRFNANPEQGENSNEMRVEYQVSQRWTFESRYGDANTGSASLIWSKDY